MCKDLYKGLSQKEVCTHILSFSGNYEFNLTVDGYLFYMNIFIMKPADGVLLVVTVLHFMPSPAIDCTDLFKGY